MRKKQVLNELLVKIFKNILKIEESFFAKNDLTNMLTIQDIHTIEGIGNNEMATVSSVAKELKVTNGTLSVAITKLINKGYILKERSKTDKRIKNLKLSKKGQAVYDVHEQFHVKFVNTITKNVNSGDMEILLNCLEKLNLFFNNDCN